VLFDERKALLANG